MIDANASESVRRHPFQRYSLRGPTLDGFKLIVRADGSYLWDASDPLFDRYADTRSIVSHYYWRTYIIYDTFSLGLLGGVVGWLEGSGRGRTIGFGVGAGLVLTSVVTALVWPDPSEDLVRVYNEALRRELALPPADRGVPPPPPVAVGYGGRF